MKFIKLFNNHSDYNTYISSNDKILPNLSYCKDIGDVHLNPWYDPERFVAKFNVTSTPFATSLFNNTSLLKELEIDGVVYTGNDIFSHYYHTFNTTGIHTVKYTLNDNVTTIDSASFAGKTNMISITIPNTITTISNGTFGGCSSLKSVTIPNSVTTIGGGVFGGCTYLKRLTIPSSVTTINGCLGDLSFENLIFELINPNATFVRDTTNKILTNTAGNTLICGFNNTIAIPNSVTTIGQYALYGCESLTSVTIGNSVTTIGDQAFYGCNGLTSITIPNRVSSIGNQAFSYCRGLTSMIVNSGNSIYDSRNNCNAIIRTSTNSLITGCQNTVIPNTITSIDQYAFGSCTGLTSITIPDSVTTIGEHAFMGCSGLISITIPNSVTFIGQNAFWHCTSLTSVTIGNGVTSIRNGAFSGCSGLTSFTIQAASPPTLDNLYTFDGTNNCPIYVPSASVETYKAATNWSSLASRIQAIP